MRRLAHPQVGEYLNRHFVSAFQKVATFQINGGQKQGGNVASYFCTPDGLVLHAVAGPVDAGTFLREAHWAQDTYEAALLEAPPRTSSGSFSARPTSTACTRSMACGCRNTACLDRRASRGGRWTGSSLSTPTCP